MKLAEPALRAGYRLHAFESLRSTNDEALRLASAGDRGKLWIVARAQTGGRGRQGRTWTSPPGNLYASLLLVDAASPPLAPQLGLVAGVALIEAVRDMIGLDARLDLKWPNDLLADNRKLAGILVEGTRLPDRRFATVMGFGVNVQSHPDGNPYPVTHLFAASSARFSLDDLMAALSLRVAAALTLWDGGRGFETLRARWLEQALPPGTPISVGVAPQRRSGTFRTIDAQGHLVLATPEGDLHIDAGDVFLMDQPAQAAG